MHETYIAIYRIIYIYIHIYSLCQPSFSLFMLNSAQSVVPGVQGELLRERVRSYLTDGHFIFLSALRNTAFIA